LYILQQMKPQGIGYNMPEIIPIGQNAQLQKLEETFIQIIKRHESLRTSFHFIDEQPVQKIHNDVEFKIEQYEITDADAPHNESVSAVMKNFVRPFDLSRTPLLRGGLVKTGTRCNLIIDMHHIISDGVSHSVLEDDFRALYKDEDLQPLRIQYKDYSQWQNRERGKQELEHQEAHWLKCYAGEIPVLNLPTDFTRPTNWSYDGIGTQFEISPGETEALKTIATNENGTLFMVLISLFSILLAKLSGQEDIVIGTPVAGRRHADLEKIIGMFVNTLALRTKPRSESTYRQFLREVTERTLADFENQEYQFEELVETVAVTRDASRNPLFDVMLAMQNIPDSANEKNTGATLEKSPSTPEGTEVKEETYRHRETTSKFDITVTVSNKGANLEFTFVFNKALFLEETIDRYIGYYKKLLSTVTGNVDTKLSQIALISVEEKKQILVEFNNTKAQYPKDKTIHQLFNEQVEKTPEATAIVAPALNRTPVRNETLTYRELNEKNLQLAALLREEGVTTGTFVALMVERSCEMVIGLLGILKAGGA
ncbi:MAG: AMP-binding protein, partial [bacterium]|nr:AMP-binding protein [bacterium]